MRNFLLFLLIIFIISCEKRKEYLEISKIKWETDYNLALQRAKKELKPVFLYFSAVWCSWCREYEKTLEKESIVELINKNFIPLLIYSDERRDLFTEYGGRGTPFTVILDYRGRVILKFHGVLKEKELKDLLLVALRGGEFLTEGKVIYKITNFKEDYKKLLNHFLEDLKQRFDPIFGGFSSPGIFGAVFKWPTPLTYRFLIERNLLINEALFSLNKDIEFLYDKIDGGFFNFYDRTRAYTYYFETSKTLKVNSLMILALISAYKKTGNKEYLSLAIDTYKYMKRILLHKDTGCFLNAQISDPDYYNLPSDERIKRKPPPSDRFIIVEDNTKAIYALMKLYKLTKNEELKRISKKCLNFIFSELFEERKLYGYYDVKEKKKGLINFERDIAFLSLAISEFEDFRKYFKKLKNLKKKFKDFVSASVMTLASYKIKKYPDKSYINGIEIFLDYQNPDDFAFLLEALEIIAYSK